MNSLDSSMLDEWRPDLGFIVEGQCEVAAYPTLLAAQLGYPVGHFPIAYAGGCDRLLIDLHPLLDDMCRTRVPRNVIITVDSMDFANHPEFAECESLRKHLMAQTLAWRESRAVYPQGVRLPDSIVPIIQHRAFETWLLADLDGLRQLTELMRVEPSIAWNDVDNEVANPVAWLRSRLKGAVNAKNPFLQKRIAKALDPTRMKAVSKSYDKFFREVASAVASGT